MLLCPPCLASPDAIMGQVFAASAEKSGGLEMTLHTPHPSWPGEHAWEPWAAYQLLSLRLHLSSCK